MTRRLVTIPCEPIVCTDPAQDDAVIEAVVLENGQSVRRLDKPWTIRRVLARYVFIDKRWETLDMQSRAFALLATFKGKDRPEDGPVAIDHEDWTELVAQIGAKSFAIPYPWGGQLRPLLNALLNATEEPKTE